jgi:putative hydrolase of the HAD superfamily
MKIRGVLFDIGDTLLAATRLQEHALEEATRALTAEPWMKDPDSFIRAYQIADKESQFDEIPNLNHLYSDVRIIARTFQILSWSPSLQQKERFLEVYRRKIRKNLKPNTELIKLLNRLRTQGLRLGIVSNGTTVEQLDQLARLKIKDYFDPILISEEVGVRKPNPNIFLRAATQWKLPTAEILVVGDRADWDMLGAARAGMKTALTIQFVDHREKILTKAKPDVIIDNLSHLGKLIRRNGDTKPLWQRKSSNHLPH